MAEQYPQNRCPVFLQIEWDIRQLIADINQIPNLLDKRDHAERLMETAQVLLSCDKYEDGRIDCTNCKNVAELHGRVAYLLIKSQDIYHFLHDRYSYS
ncbi:MAG: hypothetical protein ACE5KJ_08930 [Candidatus Zixiibacteriota bacterium]